MSKQKTLLYVLLALLVVSLNIYYYRNFFYNYWKRYQIRNEKVVLSLSTTPYRINDMEDNIKSLIRQNINLDGIYLNVPHRFLRDNLEYTIPSWLKNYPQVTVIRCQDYGPATKLLGTLEQVPLTPDTIIITVDDDTYYPKNLALELAYRAYQNPQAAYGLMGANPKYNQQKHIDLNDHLGLIKIGNNNEKVSILQGYAGVAYRRKFFDDRIFNILDAPAECIQSDDFYLSYFLAMQSIPRIVLKNEQICGCKLRWDNAEATNEYALSKLAPPVYKHDICLRYLQDKFPHVDF